MRQAMDGILPPTVRWRGGKANLSPNFMARMFQATRDRRNGTSVGNGGALARFVRPAVLDATRERFLSRPNESDALAVWQAFSLDAWLRQTGFGTESDESITSQGGRAWTST